MCLLDKTRAYESKKNVFSIFFRYVEQNRVLTVTYCANLHGPHLTANWNSGESYAAWCHARRLEWNVLRVVR